MKKICFVIMVAGVLFLANSQSVCAQSVSEGTKQEIAKPQDAGNKICPVTGEKIDEKAKVTYEYQGKIYNFCCAGCPDEFKKDPQKYIKKVEQELQAQSKNEAQKETISMGQMHEGMHESHH